MGAARMLAIFALALAASGCASGGRSDEDQVRATVRALAEATAAKDYERLCRDVLAQELLDGIERIGLPCPTAMRNSLGEVKNPRLTVGRVEVKGARATAEVRTSAEGQAPSSDIVELVKDRERWRVSSLSAEERKPASPEK